ncbi:ROK family protein [Firmicutes bacterium AM55-24TS]|nr:ROK family protein [Firmicutes bacterium AM55-24TS]RHP00902.1 ROK family protein [Firmicutes bacterium AF36-3BH]
MMYIGIDLGGTNIAAGIVREDGKIVVQSSVPTLSQRPTDEIVKDMVFLSKQLIKDAELELNDIEAVGIGCPGTINFETGEVIYSNNIKMEHYMLAKEFQKYLNLPVKIDNDANCAAMGEYIVSGNNVPIFMFITLGTGVGSGLILNGKVFRGFNGAASEAGHITLVSGGEPCTCGKRGCWETYASVTALIRQTKVAMEKNPESLMHEIAKAEGKISGRTSFDAAKQGDKAAQAVVKQYAQYVADGIVSVENVLQPDIISVGGGISREGEYLLQPVCEYAAANGFNKFMPKTKIVTAQSFNDAGIIGAAMIAK